MKYADSLHTGGIVVLLLALPLWHALVWAQSPRSPITAGHARKIARQPDARQPPPPTGHSVPVPANDQPQLVVQLGHENLVSSAAFSPDGHLIVTSGEDHKVIVWDRATGAEIRRFTGDAWVFSPVFSPDGRLILTTSLDNTARVWDAATGAEVRRLQGFRGVFSPNGQHLLMVKNALFANGRKLNDDTVAQLWDVSTGTLLQSFRGHADTVFALTFSPDGLFILTGSGDKTARLWEVATGQERRRFEGHADAVIAVGFSPDGRFLFTHSQYPYNRDSSKERAVRLLDVATGQERRRFEQAEYPVAFSRDGRFLLVGATDEVHTALLLDVATGAVVRQFENATHPVGLSPDGRWLLTIANHTTPVLWDVATGQPRQIYHGLSSSVQAVAFAPDGQHLVTGSWYSRSAQLWHMTLGQIQRFVAEAGTVGSVAFSPDGRLILTGGFNAPVLLWDAATGAEVRRLQKGGYVAFAPDGKIIFVGGTPDGGALWDAATGAEVRRFRGRLAAAAFSPDGRFIVIGGYDKTARLWDVATGKELRRFRGLPEWLGVGTAVAFAPDGRFIVTGSAEHSFYPDHAARLWNVATGQQLRRFVGHTRSVGAVAFAPDGKVVLTGSRDHTARLWDATSGKQLRRFEGHTAAINAVAFSPDGRVVVTGSEDSTTRLWQAATGKELCRLISFNDGNWVVITAAGRFDASNLDETAGLHWLMPDDPFKPLPFELFMRDYYEPRLLQRILAGEKLKPIKALLDLNRVQPKVRIISVQHQSTRDTVAVTVEVSKARETLHRDGTAVMMETGVYDLRLFRDGQLVGYTPDTDGEITMEAGTEQAVITFRDIKLPHRRETTQVEFSAYAFNVDRVKSATDRKTFELPKDMPPVKGRAYLITVGVNAYEQAAFDLHFAANDARRVQRTVFDKLSHTSAYEEVVQVSLISDYEITEGKRIITAKTATKENLKGILALLAGKEIDATTLTSIANADTLRRARPEDLVLISFSSHGFADDKGHFYLVPYDTGQVPVGRITDELIRHSISSDELSRWLRDVDAGEMVMIVDACHSAASVDVEGFKPGPMGSRGLGQLAYDKRMRILTATQADDVALESALIKQGLLTYALTHDGIEAEQADFRPKDHHIMLAEWLEYGVRRVPVLYEEVKHGQLQNFGRGAEHRGVVVVSSKENNSLHKQHAFQQPSLFDFAKRQQDVVLVRGK